MTLRSRQRLLASLFFCLLTTLAPTLSAAGLRIVTYNVDDDTGNTGNTGPRTPMADLSTILQGIGNHTLAGNARPIDVLALQELHYNNPSTSSSLTAIVNELNSVYGAGSYAFDTYVGTTTGNFVGNGPNGLIYNTRTVRLVGTGVGIGTASGTNSPRQPIRYKLHPLGFQNPADFYMYVSHYKAGPDTPPSTSNATRRNLEAQKIRADADLLGPLAHVLYTGDFNLDQGSFEPAWASLLAPGNGHANDISGAPANWINDAGSAPYLSWSSSSIVARDDFQLVSDAVLNQNGLRYSSGTYQTFGNNGTTAIGNAVNLASNTALSDLANRTQILNLLTTVTDHLPIVVDYEIIGVPIPEPGAAGILWIASLFVRRSRRST